MLQFTGKVIDVHKRVWGWYEHDIIGKDYSLMWYKTWLEPVEEQEVREAIIEYLDITE